MLGPARPLIAALCLAPLPASAQPASPPVEPTVQHALDIALDPNEHALKRYRVTGCYFHGARVNGTVCDIRRGGGGSSLGEIEVVYDRTDVDGRRRLIETCASPYAPRYRCSLDIVAEVALDGGGNPILFNARAVW